MFRNLFRPAISLMNHLKYPQKMVLMASIFSLPLAAFMYLLVSNINKGVDFAEEGMLVVQYNQSVMAFFKDLQEHRGMTNALLKGDPSFREKLSALQPRMDQHVKSIDSLEDSYGKKLGTTKGWTKIKEEWRTLQRQLPGMQAKESFDAHTSLISNILEHMAYGMDISKLTIDIGIDSFYLMDAMVNGLPLSIEYNGQIRGLGAGALASGKLSDEDKVRLVLLSGLSRSAIAGVASNMNRVFKENPSLRDQLDPYVKDAVSSVHASLKMLNRKVLYARTVRVDPSEYFTAFTKDIETSFKLYQGVTSALYSRLHDHANKLKTVKNYIRSFVLISLAVLFYLFVGNYYSVMSSLSGLMSASDHIGNGEQNVNITLEAKDEMAMVAKSFNDMAQRVAVSTSALKRANEVLEDEIAERRKAEDNLERTMAELQRSNAELKHFAYVASHDLKEPLIVVGADLKLLKRRLQGKAGRETEKFIDAAIDAARRMETLIHDLLVYSLVGIGEKAMEPTDCTAVLDRTLTNLKVAVEKSAAEITYDPLPTLMADPTQLLQLFQNLISNAIKFSGNAPPQIHISAIYEEDAWRFSVSDKGIGIPPEHTAQIFEIFQRLHSDRYPGTGIGLATCKKIVERHKGRIWAESEPGRGSTFYFIIPDMH